MCAMGETAQHRWKEWALAGQGRRTRGQNPLLINSQQIPGKDLSKEKNLQFHLSKWLFWLECGE